MEQLTRKLSEKYSVRVIKKGVVFTLLLHGQGLGSYVNVSTVMNNVLQVVGDEFPNIEVMQNRDDYLLLVLKR